MSIDWANVRTRLLQAEQSLTRIIHPDAATIRAAYHRRMLETADRRDAASVVAAKRVPVLVCLLGDERYGVELRELKRIDRLSDFAPIRGDRDGVLGVFAWQGEARTVLCLKQLLGLEKTTSVQLGDVILILSRPHEQVALRVDGTEKIVSLEDDSPSEHDALQGSDNRCTRHRTKEGINMIDMNALLQHPTFYGEGPGRVH